MNNSDNEKQHSLNNEEEFNFEDYKRKNKSLELEKIDSTPKVSQAVLDLAEMENDLSNKNKNVKEEVKDFSIKDKAKETKDISNVIRISRYRWLFLFVLSLFGVLAWVVDAQIGYTDALKNPYGVVSFIILAIAIIVTVCSFLFLSMQTGAGLMALLWSSTFFISSLYGSVNSFLQVIPLTLYWNVLLVLIILWMLIEAIIIFRKYIVLGVLLSIFILYSALSPIIAIIKRYVNSDLDFFPYEKAALIKSPEFITDNLPSFLWPITIFFLIVLLFAVLICLKNQFKVLAKLPKKHFGNFFLALAFLVLASAGSLTYANEDTNNYIASFNNMLTKYFTKTGDWQKQNFAKISFIDKKGPIDNIEFINTTLTIGNNAAIGAQINETTEADIELEKSDAIKAQINEANIKLEKAKTALLEESVAVEDKLKEADTELKTNITSEPQIENNIGNNNSEFIGNTENTENILIHDGIKVSLSEDGFNIILNEEFPLLTEERIQELAKDAIEGPEYIKEPSSKITTSIFNDVLHSNIIHNTNNEETDLVVDVGMKNTAVEEVNLETIKENNKRLNEDELLFVAKQIEKFEEQLVQLSVIAKEQGEEIEKLYAVLGSNKPQIEDIDYPNELVSFEDLDFNNLHFDLLQKRLNNIEVITVDLKIMLDEQKEILKLLQNYLENK